MSIKNLYNFKESRFTSLSHELRVYIFGADVTPWLRGDLSVTYGNRDSFNTCVFDLANPRRVWQITMDNLRGIWRREVGEYSEREKLDVFRWKNNPILNPSFSLDISAAVLGSTDIKGSPTSAGPEKFVTPPENAERRFRFAVNDCIFSRTDPMRVFMRNPYGSSASDEWVEIFCGFVQDHPVTTNYNTGESSVRISGVCIRQLLTKMRSQMNRLVNNKDPAPRFKSGFFSDFLDPTAAKHPFAGKSLEQAIKKLIIGTETPKTGEFANSLGVGDFRMGNIVCYNPKTPINTLERWHLMTLFGVNKVPFPNSAADDLWLTQQEMNSLGKATIILPDQYAQGPAGRYLHFLLPWEGTGAGSLIQSGIEEGNFRAVEWTTRWEVIRDFASKLDFQVTTSPSGDILVEFPMYGFTPHVFTTQGGQEDLPTVNVEPEEVQASKFGLEHTTDTTVDELQIQAQKEFDAANASSVAKYNEDINSGVTPYGLGALLTFELHQIEDTVNDEAEDHATVLQVDGGHAAEAFQIDDGSVYTALRAFVYSPVLVERFGVITEQLSIPFAAQRPSETAGGASGVLATRLAKLATIEFMKRMADSSTWDGSVVFRPFLFPNRPAWLKRSARMGLITSVTNRWSIGKSASTTFSMHMLMSERYYPDENKPDENERMGGKTEYRLPTGASNMPISYKSLWGEKEAGNEDEMADQFSGVRTQVGTKNPPTKDANGGAGSVGSGTSGSDRGQEGRGSGSGSVVADKNFKNDPNMYKPFVNAMDAAIKKAVDLGYTIEVTSTYRSPKDQQNMKSHPEDWGVKKVDGRYVPIGAPWGSLHQYGMAMDIKIVGGTWEDYRKFSEIAGGTIQWGDKYDKDYIHYEWKVPNGRTQMDDFRKNQGWDTSNYPADYLKKTWAAVDSKTNLSASKSAPEGSASFWENLNPFTPQETGTTPAKTSEVCSPSRLSQSGLSAIQDLANKIARATRGG